MTTIYIAMICGVIAVLYCIVTSRQLLALPAGDEKMQDIAAAIQEGAKAYLTRQYTAIAIVGVVVAVILALTLGLVSTVGFVIGAVLSGAAGFAGMNISVRANVRTAEAARHVAPGRAHRRIPLGGGHGDARRGARAARDQRFVLVPDRPRGA